MRLDDELRAWLVARTRPPVERRPRPDGAPLRVLITVDTEISLGGAARDPRIRPVGADRRIWGRTARGEYGVGLIMDLLEAHRMKGVFFFEPVARHVVEESELAQAARVIHQRGHEVELHVHPEFEMDLPRVQAGQARSPSAQLFEHSPAEQRRHIRTARAALEAWTGVPPVAFRAGGYSASEETLGALLAEGLTIDSSYNRWAVEGGLCGMRATPPLNDAAMLPPGVLEVPVSNLRARGPRGGLRPFELSALSVAEMVSLLEALWEAGARTACAVTHSFRLLRARDVQYRAVGPDHVNIHRLRALCRYLDAHRDRFQVVGFRDLPLERWRALPPGDAAGWPSPPRWSSMSRLLVQAVKDRGVV